MKNLFSLALRKLGHVAAVFFAITELNVSAAESAPAQTNLFPKVAALFTEHCLDCHAVQDPEGKLILETYELMLKGGETGPAFVPGKSGESLLIKMVEGKTEKDGKPHFMPPGKRKKLSEAEVAVLKQWINAGAPPPSQEIAREVVIPKITPKAQPISPIQALAYSMEKKMIAAGRFGEVQIYAEDSQDLVKKFSGFPGMINAVAFSPDGKSVYAGGGRSGLSGEIYRYDLDDSSGKPALIFSKHPDAIYSLAVSPDGKTIASGSYDQKIKLWDAGTAKEMKTLSGHTGAIFGLAFRNDGKLLASASGDRTVKLWDAQSGERRDTLSQSLKELYTVAFSPDGKKLIAGGADNRIRQWEISEKAAETTNPLLISKFGHEGAILKLTYSADGKTVASSADDRSVKLFKAEDLQERSALEKQDDWAPALAFASSDKALAVGRINGTLQFYDAASGSKLAPPAPVIAAIEPRGVKLGTSTKIKITGKNLGSVKEVKFDNTSIMAKLTADSLNAMNSAEVWIEVTIPENLTRGMQEFAVTGKGGASGKTKLYLDSIPQLSERDLKDGTIASLPASIWAAHEVSGNIDRFSFVAKAGQTLVFDAAAKSIGSKAGLVMTLADSEGKVIESSNGFDKSADPLIAHKFARDGAYHISLSELLPGGSAEHFYRLDIGDFPYVTAVHPVTITKGQTNSVQFIGFNLPQNSSEPLMRADAGESQVEADARKYRSRGSFKLKVTDLASVAEKEPNNKFAEATALPVPGAVAGRIASADSGSDEDWYRFEAKKGQPLVFETFAAQINSPVDTRIEIMNAKGEPVIRTLLQATRDSAITFRGISSDTVDCRVENWEEMELNQYLYLQGEVVRLFRAPQGPDSGFNFYGLNGKRRNYFDTTSTAHANAEPCYIVEAHPPGSKLNSNGLPVFTVFYANDDDAEKRTGTDSRLYFTAPADGVYYARVIDTRNFSGDRFVYALTAREANPNFNVTLNGANPTVPAGSGKSFSVSVDRSDGFDEEIVVDIAGVPSGFMVSTPLVIQAGHQVASGTIWAEPSATAMTDDFVSKIKVSARAKINGSEVIREVNSLGKITLGPKPALLVAFEPEESKKPAGSQQIAELTIAPGQTIPAWLKVTRNGHTELMTFSVDNLPHGVIVDNIGLSGVLIPKDQTDREIFLTAARWVPETDRLCYAVCNEAGRQTSRPVLLKVRKPGAKPAVASK